MLSRLQGAAIAIALLGGLVAAMPAQGQTRLDYAKASPQALVQAWKGAPDEERELLATAMASRRAQMLPALRQSARAGDRTEKMFAIAMLADLRDRDGVPTVIAATSDADVRVRRRAATALRLLADQRAAGRLREILASETDLGVVKTAMVALGRLGDRRDVALIAPFLSHADYGVVVVAAGSLAMLGDERGLDTVIQATLSPDPGVQKSATYALGLFSAPAATQRLQAIVQDPNGAWKGYALVGLAERKLATEPAAQHVKTLEPLARGRSRTLAEWAVDKLTDIGTPDALAVMRSLSDKETPVRYKAERRLRALGVQP